MVHGQRFHIKTCKPLPIERTSLVRQICRSKNPSSTVGELRNPGEAVRLHWNEENGLFSKRLYRGPSFVVILKNETKVYI